MFYPEWKQDSEGCRNDGLEPDYMAVNPTEWLSSTKKSCCQKYFGGYMYDDCMGRYPPDHDDCNTMLFYPDWQGANEGCLDDGKEPYYMLSNHKLFLSNTRDDCCKKFYEWDFFSCTGTSPELTHGEFYPDYTDSSTPTCLDDGNIPTYMLNDQRWYLSTTLRQCCERHFHYNINACLGTSYGGSDKWYVKFDARTCAKDCVGASPCGGIAASWDELFDSKEKCCETKMFWDIRCRTRSV